MANITAQIGETLLLENGIAVTFVGVEGEAVRMVVNSRVLGRQSASAVSANQEELLRANTPASRLRKRLDA